MQILHVTTRAAWETAVAAGAYRADSLDTEGFIHCSTPSQIIDVANALYRGHTNLVLLIIEQDLVDADVVYEDCYEMGEEFPHIYGPLNVDAVVNVVAFPPNEDGTFTLPAAIRSH